MASSTGSRGLGRLTKVKITKHLLPDAEAVANAAADLIADAALTAITQRGKFRIVLAGGSTPEATYRKLRMRDLLWHGWEIYYGDERCVERDDPRRNSQMVASVLTSYVSIPPGQDHKIPAEIGADRAASIYAEEIAGAPFDLVVHGMGEDGHTASLFPGGDLDPNANTVAVRDAPKPPPERVSLGLKALRNTWSALVIVTGSAKRQALGAWLAGNSRLPIARVCEGIACTVIFDSAAAGDMFGDSRLD